MTDLHDSAHGIQHAQLSLLVGESCSTLLFLLVHQVLRQLTHEQGIFHIDICKQLYTR